MSVVYLLESTKLVRFIADFHSLLVPSLHYQNPDFVVTTWLTGATVGLLERRAVAFHSTRDFLPTHNAFRVMGSYHRCLAQGLCRHSKRSPHSLPRLFH